MQLFGNHSLAILVAGHLGQLAPVGGKQQQKVDTADV
jgi:hypothetical protein